MAGSMIQGSAFAGNFPPGILNLNSSEQDLKDRSWFRLVKRQESRARKTIRVFECHMPTSMLTIPYSNPPLLNILDFGEHVPSSG
jgi:hypothetical protein